jgi:PBSX family phage portal protein
MTVTKAYVLEDGEVISESYMDRYALKAESKKIPVDMFENEYDKSGLVTPLYNLEGLAQLLEINTYHYRAVKTKARDIAGLGWSIVPIDGVKHPSEEQKEKVKDFFMNCNPLLTITEINDRVMVDHEATGNGYFEIIRDENDLIVGLEHIPSHTVRIHKDMKRYAQIRGNKKVWFKALGVEDDLDFETGEFYPKGELPSERKANEIMHIKNYTSRSDYYGLPDVVPSLSAILGDKESKEYNISFFENHAIPAYAVTVTGADLDENTEKAIRRFFQNDVKKNNHSTLVLTAKKSESDLSSEPIEIKFQKLSTEMKEASFRMYRQDNRDEILSAHGVPPYRAGITVEGSLGGSTAKESTEIYKQSIIKPKQEMLESRFNRFILQEGLGITDWKFKFNELDTRDEEKLINKLKTLFDIGAYSPNRILEELGEERVDNPNMDRHFVYGKPIDASNEETIALFDGLKSLHQDLIKIATKGYKPSYTFNRSEIDRLTDAIKDFNERQVRQNEQD